MKSSFLLPLSFLILSQVAYAQQDSAPQEAPYIQEEDEFDAFSSEMDTSTAPVPSAPVNLNEPSDKNLEAELGIEESDIIAEDSLPAPAPTPVPIQPKRPVQKPKNARGGVEYIEHPQAKKGLRMITKEGAYIYRDNKKIKYDKSGAFRVGMMDAPKIQAADGTTFSDMYSGNSQPIFNFDFEWQPFQSFGRLGVQAGFGFLVANGAGRFLDGSGKAKERYTFVAVPLNLGVVYRFEYWDRQWVTPYASGGGSYIGVAEFRDDGKSKTVGTPGGYGGGGLLLNISAASRETGHTLKSEYGIMNMWVSLDYKYMVSFNQDLDFSSNVIGAGVVVDY